MADVVDEYWVEDPTDDSEYHTYFVDCTCEYDSDEHGWGCCEVVGYAGFISS